MGEYLEDLLSDISTDLKRLGTTVEPYREEDATRRGSRYAGPNADASLTKHLAAGGTLTTAPRSWDAKAYGGGLARGMKALAEGTASSGGYLVESQVSDEILTMVRSQSAVVQMRPRVLEVDKELLLTSMASGASAYYVAENAAIPPSEETFGQAPLLRPTDLAALVPISNRLLRDAADSPDVEDVIRQDLAEVLALRQDLAFLRGTGTLGEPRGVRNTPGMTPGPAIATNGTPVDFALLKGIVAAVRDAGAAMRRPGFIFHPKIVSRLDALVDGDGHFYSESDSLIRFDRGGTSGTVVGVPFVTSRQIPTNLVQGSASNGTEIYFGDWSEAFIGENQSLTIETSGEASYTPDGGTTWISTFQNRQTLFRAVMAHDFALRRPEWFSVVTGVLV
jgi:HK97 family phage major capsid protein